jgi:hypothetical protein
MPNLPFFADERDRTDLAQRLNADPEVAFLVPDGPLDPQVALAARLDASRGDRTEITVYPPFGMIDDGYRQRWKAVRSVAGLKDGRHSLWHIPAGPLPLLTIVGRTEVIPDPWGGWVEQSPGADPTTPYFGPGHVAEIRLELRTRHRPYTEAEKASLPMLVSTWDREEDVLVGSSFGWIGGRRRPATQPTWRWWNRLKAWIKRAATDIGHGRHHFWAFPSALRKLKGGMAYDAWGWDLTNGIRTARIWENGPEQEGK